MQLQREELSQEALAESVDLHRTHRGIIEATALIMHQKLIPGVGYVATQKSEEMIQGIRAAGFEGLAKRKWRKLIGAPTASAPMSVEFVEWIIEVEGQYCRIDTQEKLQKLQKTIRAFEPRNPEGILLAITETAVEQAMDKRQVSAPSHDLLTGIGLELDLMTERDAITRMTFEKVMAILQGS